MSGNKGVMSLLVIVVLATVYGICSAKTVIVGDNTGWTVPSSASFYPNWASQQNLQVGDVLVFNFPATAHTVAEVSKANYDSCTTTTTVGPVLTTPPANVTLTAAGSHYFLCTIPTHCGFNQKLAVSVSAATTSTPTPTPTAAPKKSPTTSPAQSPSPVSSTATPPTPSVSTAPISPVGMGPSASFPMGPTAGGSPASGAKSAPPPAHNFAAATGVSILSLLSVIVASAVLF
ncbi:hypothetical protein KSS87_017667 [Heliosperma pusillum]|nr:hypothetical protein KSS87_014671 [Heliosperma pusillum]KAH9617502.1 hypothetical protein KSS87_006352 [Heliosperma pusillum]KAH9625417.1 hypothetical protein KSS87_017667 [Heliosperma pusillum]